MGVTAQIKKYVEIHSIFQSKERARKSNSSFWFLLVCLFKALLELHIMCTENKCFNVHSVSVVGNGALKGAGQRKGTNRSYIIRNKGCECKTPESPVCSLQISVQLPCIIHICTATLWSHCWVLGTFRTWGSS